MVDLQGTDFAQLEEVYTDLQMQLVPCALGGATVGRCANGFYQAYQVRMYISPSLLLPWKATAML